ncbi:hypothetical protein Afil01_52350 [Actinorhabdospora filicis]|uniref:Uncharacterized protein n=1 Tax=Actinorhabdospora filicis TaxID=1785913 RepID=A0A9W6SQU4_9ACTN|nr:hypothetical protein [Actinorhabdospora filicis]GLZ80428.1 hypothetical protein Afil01_52350 [Actinorhabdospora filicis]
MFVCADVAVRRAILAELVAPARPGGYFQYRVRDGVLYRRECAGASGGFAPVRPWEPLASTLRHPLDAGRGLPPVEPEWART